MPERSTKPVTQKLGMKLDERSIVLNAPDGFAKKLKGGPKLESKLVGEFDFIHFFAQKASDVDQMLPRLRKALRKSGVLWVSWRNEHGLEGVSLIAIDDEWAAMKALYPKGQRER